jgi:antirestriction protein ArdC
MSNTIQAKKASKAIDTHQEITNIILEQLEKGVVPWQQPWKGGNELFNRLPFNTSTGNKYRGVNIVLLWASALKHGFQSNEWGTFNHWNAAGEYIRKGEGERKAMIVKYGKLEKQVDGETVEIPYLQKFWVFNRCQLQSWQPSEEAITVPSPSDLIIREDALDEFVANTGAIIASHDGGASYSPADDKIRMPYPEKFIATDTLSAAEGFYSTIFHELTHWSGAPHRLNRTKGKKFGDHAYAFEELVAELGAAFLCTEFDISTVKTGDHAAYIDNWIKVLKDNKQMLVTAAAEASKAFDYLFELQPA